MRGSLGQNEAVEQQGLMNHHNNWGVCPSNSRGREVRITWAKLWATHPKCSGCAENQRGNRDTSLTDFILYSSDLV